MSLSLGVKHVRRHLAALVSISMVAAFATLTLSAPADAAPFSGGFSPFIFDDRADLNGDTVVNGRDDSNAFYGDTHIIDGMLDCNNWGTTYPGNENAGTAGDGAITAADNCRLIGYDGTADGVTIDVVAGEFDWSGPLPTVFPDPATPNNPDVGDSRFAWSTINGRVDTNGDETIDANDCHFGLIHENVDAGFDTGGAGAADGADVVANTVGNTDPCGFGSPAFTSADNGKVDLNSDKNITTADSCTNGCFFRHNVTDGVVQEIPAPAGAPAFTGGLSPTLLGGRADLNYDGLANGRDDANAFYGDTHIIDGFLDCNAWTSDNHGAAGDGDITSADDCTLIGYDGTADGVTINVVDGFFQAPDGPLPTVFPDPATPNNPDVGDSRFAWSAIGGRVDSNGNEAIDANDCHFGLIGETIDAGLGDATDGADILSNDGTNQCGFVTAPDPANNGLVDLNSDTLITAADSCTNGCFFGHNLANGVVQDTSGPAAVFSHDFNGDGFSDAAFGVPGEDLGKRKNAGTVNVVYGSSGGLTSTGDQAWTLASTGNTNGIGNKFGAALAAGDFDNDGFDDLAVGIPGRGSSRGAVSVIYGTTTGLAAAGNNLLTQNTLDIEGVSEAGDRFGSALAAGDMNGDGFSDLAIGAPGEDVGSIADAGSVNVIYGSAGGLTAAGPPVDQLWSQGSGGIGETAETDDEFGGSLASGDLNGDGEFDLVIGAPREGIGTATLAGLAHVIYGTTSGLASGGNQTFHQDTADVEDAAESGDLFAFSVAAGDLNGDTFDDVAFGVPKEDVDGRADAGAVNVLFGSSSGLAAANDQFLRQGASGVEGSHEPGDQFGFALTTGDFNGDGEFDLGVGVPGEDIGKKSNAGAVNVLHGATGTGGLLTTNDQLWFQDSPAIAGKSEKGDLFGGALSSADYNNDDHADISVGVHGEDFGLKKKNGGMANVLYGSATGLTATGNQAWHQDSAGIGGKVEKGDVFGKAIS